MTTLNIFPLDPQHLSQTPFEHEDPLGAKLSPASEGIFTLRIKERRTGQRLCSKMLALNIPPSGP